MAIRQIVKEGDDVLTKKCREVVKFDDRLAMILDDMTETLHLANGVGLAAPQVGILRRIVVVDVGEGPIELVNPVIIEQSGEQEGLEGCLSCPGEWGITKRPMNVTVKAFDRKGKEFTVSGEGLLAKAFCHELDHLEGVLYKQIAIRMVSPEELEEIEENN
ncbi:MAG: peptide deformylase [bacterium]|nr:peptide deformylase [bacterium]MDD6224755.1 peptide deformylase [bacterium]MDY3861532.1 peptide deformylase [Ruminococcus sp.]